MRFREHHPDAFILGDVAEGSSESGLALVREDDGTVTVLAFADGGDSWHGARVSWLDLLAALGAHLWFTREQVEAWAERPLSDAEVDRLDECIPFSSIPEAIAAIVAGWDAR